MARDRDFAPIGNTCPMIDEVISAIEALEIPENDWHSKAQLVEIMEKIRAANTELRKWGNEEYREKLDLEKENDHLKTENDSLKDEVKYLESLATTTNS